MVRSTIASLARFANSSTFRPYDELRAFVPKRSRRCRRPLRPQPAEEPVEIALHRVADVRGFGEAVAFPGVEMVFHFHAIVG